MHVFRPEPMKRYWLIFAAEMNYKPVVFNATDGNGQAIYHTNVLMCVADSYVVICLESISDPLQNKLVVETIVNSDKKLIPITLHQMNHFAGNMLQVENKDREKLLVMSSQAYESLTTRSIAGIAGIQPDHSLAADNHRNKWRWQCPMHDGRSAFAIKE